MSLFRTAPRYADGDVVDLAGPSVRLKVSGRARRVSLRLDRVRREVLAIAPNLRRLPDAVAFARERCAWVADRLAELAPKETLAPDAVTLFGAPVRLEAGPGRARLIEAKGEAPARIVGCGREALDPWTAARVIRRASLAWFKARAEVHCARLGVPTPPVSAMDARTRWGSCSPASRASGASIRLSWRLALAPPEVADYVVAHECAHLMEMNHSARFWAHVHALVGDHRPHRAWLRKHGTALHAFGR